MRFNRSTIRGLLGSIALIATLAPALAADDVSFDLKYGVLVSLTGESAPAGQAWNAATKLGIDQIKASIDRLGLEGITLELTDSQDSQGSPAAGVEGAQKLVQIDNVDVIVGDFYSSITSAVATAVTMPNGKLIFTGGTSPALSKLNTSTPAMLWQPVPADDLQGKVLAQIIAKEFGANAKINVAARNDAYGTALAEVFTTAWKAGGGTVPKEVLYNPEQPTLDTEAQQLVDGAPDGWLFIDFCPTFEKLALPLGRTGKWDPAKSFGADSLAQCARQGGKSYPGFRATQASAAGGTSFGAFQKLFAEKVDKGIPFESTMAQPFDSTFVVFLAALEAKSSDPTEIANHVQNVTNDPGTPYTYEQIDDAIKAVLKGEKIHYMGASGPLNFGPDGRVNASLFDVWQHQPDNAPATVIETIAFKP
ncbi:ABC transporter substrate-binding protein [Kaistia dalseonensis]|uniref:Branched-chain amino acid transport system substrate-binding protein n=1 Tax=Kaistia dalseonensis TaxID=410840 RepID=A0ABU0H216_9HYPH|nr:ABC transporter substrate-binding protein [Kaistia dalseonensis]MCX5493385.1 ABC transporter substrate-binding protein [Kaistia dalseonensis]MDQ0435943.1 branched-chain amino acid transport system substrate-binding protein [Kaistia dalseonensis]